MRRWSDVDGATISGRTTAGRSRADDRRAGRPDATGSGQNGCAGRGRLRVPAPLRQHRGRCPLDDAGWRPRPGGVTDRGALRELREETGWADLVPGRLLCTWEHDFTWHGTPVRQHEHIYVTDGPHRGPVGDVSEVHRTDRILGWRWWTPADLADPDADALWPPQLPALLAAARAAGRPDGSPSPAPVELGHVPQGTPNSRPDAAI
ncbi:NUDIX domain-containing protein [Kitasatospora paranensis]|uniref:NUDIX domain-containing protein n=1 Tax=Kitasatospora paranensis TaxID=258053 RepID=UPI0031F134E8